MPDTISDMLDNGFRHARRNSNIPHTMPSPSKPRKPTAPAEAINRHLGTRVKNLRTARDWSLEALANASGVSRSMLSQIEREEANPTLAVTLRIAQAFSMGLGELLEMPGAASAVSVIARTTTRFTIARTRRAASGRCRR